MVRMQKCSLGLKIINYPISRTYFFHLDNNTWNLANPLLSYKCGMFITFASSLKRADLSKKKMNSVLSNMTFS